MINEFDIKDWNRLEPVPLYDVKRDTPVEVDKAMYWFDHLDGMYSVCHPIYAGKVLPEVVHLAAFVNVIPYARNTQQKTPS